MKVNIDWEDIEDLTEDTIEMLNTHGLQRANEMFGQGYYSGELCSYYTDENTDEEIDVYGWWSIDK
jgi:hypothetical protein